MYEYVVVAPPSYEHAQTSTSVWRKQSLKLASSASKHTVPESGASPRLGWDVASQPASSVPHVRSPGGSVGMRVPAPASKTYQSAAASAPRRADASVGRIGASSCESEWKSKSSTVERTLRHSSRRYFTSSTFGQPPWHIGCDGRKGGGGGDGGGGGGDGLGGGFGSGGLGGGFGGDGGGGGGDGRKTPGSCQITKVDEPITFRRRRLSSSAARRPVIGSPSSPRPRHGASAVTTS